MVPEIPTDPVAALMLLANVVVIPLLVWLLGRRQLTGDAKRILVLAVSAVLGVINAVLTQALAAPTVAPRTLLEWLTLIIMYAVVIVVYSQVWYILLKGRLDANADDEPPVEPAERAEV